MQPPYDWRQPGERSGSFGPMHDFKRLTSLYTLLDVLLGHPEDSNRYHLKDVIPQQLQKNLNVLLFTIMTGKTGVGLHGMALPKRNSRSWKMQSCKTQRGTR
ncbi:hypothetical protein AJ80_07642 [Polytolypa hystricis UAMH7299]|uniref:Uncharacterized protein n=1 Tax=Polytolypa hystricis (strain UAMH7299) TaxID=1447883 RepID=A0A2B7XLM9_POLH7|nr:hypothetical protein AJ80_07642 [Polytolypa hystricis UAMH7299]